MIENDGYGLLPNKYGTVRKFTQGEIDAIFEGHSNWQKGQGQQVRAYFPYCDLSGLDLSGKSLTGMNCEYVNFTGCNMRGADLRQTSFRHANFTDADLANAKVLQSNFMGATMDNVNVYGWEDICCVGNGKQIKNLFIYKYPVTYTNERMAAGCIEQPIDWWRTATLADIQEYDSAMDSLTMELIQICLMAIDKSPVINVRNEP